MINELIDFVVRTFSIPRQTVATILITLTTFILGILINLFLAEAKNYLQRKIRRQLSRINYKLLLKGVYKQAIEFNKFKKQLTIDHEGSFDYLHRTIPAIDVFNKLGYENLYKAYFRGFENFTLFKNTTKINAYNNLWASIEYLNRTHNESFDTVKTFIEDNAKLNELRNLSLGQVQQIIEDFGIYFHRKLELKEPLGMFYDKREKIIATYMSDPDHTLPRKTQDYIDKLLNLNRTSIDTIYRYEADIRSVKLNSLLLESSLRYQNMKNHLESINKSFEHLEDTYFERYKILKSDYKLLTTIYYCCK